MKTVFKDYVLGAIRQNGKSVDDVCMLCGISKSTFYKRLSEPDGMDRQMIRTLHKYASIPYEELVERR